MKKLMLLIILSTLLLTGCIKDESTVAYWVDSSYKSPMDYDAQQKCAMENELEVVRTGVDEILKSTPLDLTMGADYDPTAKDSTAKEEETKDKQ